MKKIIALLAASLLVLMMIAPALADAEDGSLEYILGKGTLVLGLDDTFAPMGFREEGSNEIVGFDIDVARLVCERLGVELVLQPVDWNAKEMELATRNIDCIWNGLSITAPRLETMSMTDPYMNNAMALVSTDAANITPEGIAGKVLGVQAASYAEEMILSEDYADLAGSVAEIVAFDEYATAFLDLANGNLDAILVDSVFAGYATQNLDGEYFIGESLEDDLYGVAFRLEDIALRDAVNAILAELKADGTLAELSIQWTGEDRICYDAD